MSEGHDKVCVPSLIRAYCQQIKVIKPFDTFVCVDGIDIPGVLGLGYREIVVKEVSADGEVKVNVYRIKNGEREFEQPAQFLPPNGLIQMIHMGLFIPQSFFLQFTGTDVDLEETTPMVS